MFTSTERQDKMNRVVFQAENLTEIRKAVCEMVEIFKNILETPFEHGNYFGCKEVLDRLMKLDKNEWRDIRSKYINDPFHNYIQGDFNDAERNDPAKILMDLISLLSVAEKEVYLKLQDYEAVFRKLKDEKRSMEEKLNVAEQRYLEEVQSHSVERIDLKSTQGKVTYLETLIEEKNQKIADLQRNSTVELWEREKKKVLLDNNAKLVQATEELAEFKRVNASTTKKIQLLEEQNCMMKMKQEMSSKPSGMQAAHALEDEKRKNFLLEKDVMFMEETVNGLQKVYVAILGGIRTDLHIVGEKYRDPKTNELTDEDLDRLDARVCYIYEKAKNAELEKAKNELLPHYLYIPKEIKLKKIRRISVAQKHTPKEVDPAPAKSPKMSRGRRNRKNRVTNTSTMYESDENEPKKPEKKKLEDPKPSENPSLTDDDGHRLDWDECKKHFPHLTKDFIQDQWTGFKEFDINGDRSLDFSEVISALSSLGMQFTAGQAEEAMKEVDVNKSGSLDFFEYLIVTDKILKQSGRAQLFRSGVVKSHNKAVAKTCVVQ